MQNVYSVRSFDKCDNILAWYECEAK